MSTYKYPKPLPKRRPGKRPALIQAKLLEEIEEQRAEGPVRTSGRFLFYRLTFHHRAIEKQWLDASGRPKARQPSQLVSEILTELRDAQVVGMDEVVDRSRGVLDLRGWETVAAGVEEQVRGIPLDPWQGDPPILVVESDSLAGVLEPLAIRYRVVLVPLRGQGSQGLLGGELPRYLHDGARVLYLGDLDLSGGHIEDSARARAEAYGGVELDWRRLALTAEQAAGHGLEAILKADKRFRPIQYFEAIETEALPQRVLVRVVTDALDELLPQPLEHIEQAEERQRAEVLRRLNGSGE